MTILILKPGGKSVLKCDNCGIHFERVTHRIKPRKLHFCSTRCRIIYQKKNGTYRKSVKDIAYRTAKIQGYKDAKNKKKDEVKKRCMTCGRIYYGPPGDFPKSRDPNEPEPGLCGCKQRIPYDEGETAGVVM